MDGTARRRRPMVWAAATVALILVVSGGAVWLLTRFEAERTAIAGLPFDLLVQSGVSDAEVRAVRDGLRLAHRYTTSDLGGGVRERVEVRLARERGCVWGTDASGPSTAWAEPRLMCVNTRSAAWREAVASGSGQAEDVIAHEHVHNLQGQLGCFRAADEHEWLWLFEGTAVHLAHRAMVADGRWDDAHALARIRRWGVGDPSLGPLRDYEHGGAGLGDPAYALFHLATRSLAARPSGDAGLVTFCKATAAGRPWRQAFAEAFGIPVTAFYVAFEKERHRLTPAGPAPPAAGRSCAR